MSFIIFTFIFQIPLYHLFIFPTSFILFFLSVAFFFFLRVFFFFLRVFFSASSSCSSSLFLIQVLSSVVSWIVHDLTVRRRLLFDVVRPVRFLMIPQRKILAFTETIQDLSLKVALKKHLQVEWSLLVT